MLSRIERGLVSPSVETLDRIANGLGVPVSRFFSDQTSHATRLAKLKKADIASEAERLADGTGWMPAVFKSGRDTEPQEGAEDVGAPEDAADEVEAHALAA